MRLQRTFVQHRTFIQLPHLGLNEDLLEQFIESSEKLRCLVSTRAQPVARQADFEEKQIFLMAFSEDIRSFIVKKLAVSALSSSTDTATQQVKCVDVRPEDRIYQVSRSSRMSRVSTVRLHANTSASCAGSVHSSVSLLRLKEEQRHAELMVRAASTKEQHELEITKHELKLKEDDLRLHTELNISAARIKALNKFEEGGDARSPHSSARSMSSAKFVGEAIRLEHFAPGAYVPNIKVATPFSFLRRLLSITQRLYVNACLFWVNALQVKRTQLYKDLSRSTQRKPIETPRLPYINGMATSICYQKSPREKSSSGH